jgi:hypothetical protein
MIDIGFLKIIEFQWDTSKYFSYVSDPTNKKASTFLCIKALFVCKVPGAGIYYIFFIVVLRWFASTLSNQEPLKTNGSNSIHQVSNKGTWVNGFSTFTTFIHLRKRFSTHLYHFLIFLSICVV